jgi:hypothetical protein
MTDIGGIDSKERSIVAIPAPIPPITVDSHGELLFFESAEKAEEYLEPVDVTNGEYIAYDALGRRLALGIENRKWRERGFWRFLIPEEHLVEQVVIEPAESIPTHANELTNKLRTFLVRVGESQEWLSRASLDELIRRGIERYKTE